jgi:hypothetical protein
MKTLVIHPHDDTTNFLCEIYKDKDWTVISDIKISSASLKRQIKAHDRIIMLGHGTGEGLICAIQNSYACKWLINSSLVYLLREKNCVGIWCNADVFFNKYKLKGFYTGMIISEHTEAIDFAVNTTADELLHSNVWFAKCVKDSIDAPNMLSEMKNSYDHDINPVIDFNKKNLYENL